MNETVSKKLLLAAEAYSDDTILRTLVNAIPYIGSSIDVFISSRASKIVHERIESLLNQLRTDMSSLRENMIDQAFLESGEWFDLVVRAIESATRTRDSGKIGMYSKILRNSVIENMRASHDPERYLTVLAELTPPEIHLAKAIYTQQSDRPTENENELHWATHKGWNHLAIDSGIENDDLPFLLKRLERSGLIREVTGTYYDYTGGVYIVTEVFRKLMGYIAWRP